MNKYVDADALKERLSEWEKEDIRTNGGVVSLEILVDEMPAADVAPVRHGTWVDNIISVPGVEEWGDIEREIFAPDYKDGYKCSLCGEQTDRMWFRFCPRCGARMDA